MTKPKRCPAGFDNAGACKEHPLWHTADQATTCKVIGQYPYDRCRRDKGHEGNCFPECGGMMTPDLYFDSTSRWMEALDEIAWREGYWR